MNPILHTSIIPIAILIYTSTNYAMAQCPGHSWIVELHSQRRAINCKAAAQEISQAFGSLQSALGSGRSVEIDKFGQFLVQTSKKIRASDEKRRVVKKITFRPSAELSASVNEHLGDYAVNQR